MSNGCLPYLRPRGTRHIQRASRPSTDHTATLVRAQWVCTGLRRLTFDCGTLDRSWFAGDRLLIRVCDHHRRYYTIAKVDPRRGQFEVLAVAHPQGAAGRWAGEVSIGETCSVFGPKPDLDVGVEGARQVVLLGDETTLGLFEAVRSGRQRTIATRGALEHAADVALDDACSAGLTRLARDPQRPGAALHAWVRENLRPEPRTVYFVNGHGAAVRSLRLTLLAMGIPGAAIRSRAYWGRG